MKNKKLLAGALRKLIYCLLILLAFILQFTVFPKMNITLPLYLLIPLTISVALAEKEFTGMLTGLFAGALWDLASPVTDGFLALTFCTIGFLTGLFARYLLRNTILTALLLNAAATAVYSVILEFHFIETVSFELLPQIIKEHFIIPIIFTLIIALPVHFIVMLTDLTTKHREKPYAPVLQKEINI